MPQSLSEFADKLNEALPIIIREFASRHAGELYKGKITLPQFLTLGFINGHSEARMTDVARFMNVSTAAMTGIVDRLVKSGYCVRQFEPEDRRIIKVRLTAKGAELVKKIKQKRRQMIINTFGRISQKEREAYLKILLRIRGILTQEKEA